MPEGKKLIIFDADGTLRRCTVPGQVCPNAPDQWELLPGVKETLAGIQWGSPGKGKTALGIASNQAGIERGYLTEELADRMLLETVAQAAGFSPVEGSVQICPHSSRSDCGCRKPGPLMLRRLMRFWDVRTEDTLFVGDMESDRQAAENAGCDFAWAKDFFGRDTPHKLATPDESG
ncbi:MAG: HAD-IIIA family hydrolase [PVC group bacterium]